VLLFFAVSRILGVVAERMQHLSLGWIAAATVITVAQAIFAALRWRAILGRCGAETSFADVTRYTFISLFFSQVLPSTIGGDVARIWLVTRQGAGWEGDLCGAHRPRRGCARSRAQRRGLHAGSVCRHSQSAGA
jgi:glycosyltransferase 2 family protein